MRATSQYWQHACSPMVCISAVFFFNFHWWCNVEVAPTVIRKTCQVILESHSFEKIKRIKNGTQFCPNSKASNGQHCSNSVWTNGPQAKLSTAVSPLLSNEENGGFMDSLRLISNRYDTLLLIWLKMQHLKAVFVTPVLKITALRFHHTALIFFFLPHQELNIKVTSRVFNQIIEQLHFLIKAASWSWSWREVLLNCIKLT